LFHLFEAPVLARRLLHPASEEATMEPEPTELNVRGQCPCCGEEELLLYTCLACDWSVARSRVQSKQRLERFRAGIGRSAYNLYGCFVCETCWRQMRRSPSTCPLKLFYDMGARLQPASTRIQPPSTDTVCDQWEAWLDERGWPEITEAHWHRLVNYLAREQDEA
jgi:hypothetical protein